MSTLAPDVRRDAAAHDLLRTAHEAAYRYPAGFAGFAANLTFTRDDRGASGWVRLRSPRDLALEIDADDGDEGWIRREIGSIAGHRWEAPYDAADGRYALTLGPDDGHLLGRLIEFADDPFSSSYRVTAGRITQVNRQMGGVRFSINLQEHLPTGDGRALPSCFTVSFWDAEQGRLTRADTYRDHYVPVAAVYLPAIRRVVTADDAGMTVREIRFSDHELLQADPGTATAGADHRRAGGAKGGASRVAATSGG